ncbi:ComEC/Rec2 family competence protein [Patescibacteria group bacterium]
MFISQFLLLSFFISSIFLISLFWGRKKVSVVGFVFLFFALGIFWHQRAEFDFFSSELKRLNDTNEIITLIGVVSKEPDMREKSMKLTVTLDSGTVLVTTSLYPKYEYGDKIQISGKLETPMEFEDFNYREYLKKEGIHSVMYFPGIKVVEKGQGNFVFSKILQLKNILRKQVFSFFSPPESSILGAMILGDKRQISDEWKEKLNIAGVRHITAISGLHVSILTIILMTLLIGLGFWRHQAFYFTIILIALFVIMIGLQPSAIRAGIMGGLFLFAQYLGRMNYAPRAIVLAAAFMLIQNPFLLTLDIGFQLSFLAMMGIIFLLQEFKRFLSFIPFENMRSILAMTFSAYLFTLPILIYNFGYISLVSPITNVLIVPLLYWIMIFGFIFTIFSAIFPFLGIVFAFPVWIFLTYIVKIVNWFSGIPLASLTLENIHWAWLLGFYAILGFAVFKLKEKEKPKFFGY